jgi:hypothetical protein
MRAKVRLTVAFFIIFEPIDQKTLQNPLSLENSKPSLISELRLIEILQ